MMGKANSRKRQLLFFALFLVLLILSIKTNVMGNLWGLGTGQGYLIPEESSLFRFKVNQMNTGSGEYWLYAEDENNYYSMMSQSGKKPYLLISKESAVNCAHFNKLDVKTWYK